MQTALITKVVLLVNVKLASPAMASTNAMKLTSARVLIVVSMATVSRKTVKGFANVTRDSNLKTVSALILMNVKKLVQTNINAMILPAKILLVHTSASVNQEHDSWPTVRLVKI